MLDRLKRLVSKQVTLKCLGAPCSRELDSHAGILKELASGLAILAISQPGGGTQYVEIRLDDIRRIEYTEPRATDLLPIAT